MSGSKPLVPRRSGRSRQSDSCSAARISGRRSRRAEGKPGGTSGGSCCSVSDFSAKHGIGVFPQQEADLILGLLDLPLDLPGWFPRRCRPVVRAWRRSSSVETPCASRDLVSSSDSSRVCRVRLRDFELVVQFAQCEISGGHVADQGCDHSFAIFIRTQEIGARGLGGAAQLTPDVDFERQQLQRGGSEIPILRGQKLRGKWRGSLARQAIDLDGSPGAEVRKLVGTRDSERGASLFHAGDSVAQVVVSLQRRGGSAPAIVRL